MPSPLPAAPFLVRRRYLIVMPRPLPRLLPAADAAAAREEQSADEAAVVCHRYLIVVSRSLLAAPVIVRHR
jgi:hypothetical protein